MNKTLLIGGGVGLVAMSTIALWWLWQRRTRRGGAPKDESWLASSLRDEKAKSEIILNAIDDGVVLIDDRQTIQHLNQGGCDIVGWDKQEAIGLDWRSVFRFVDDKGQNIADIDVPFNRVQSEGQPFRDSTMNLVSKSNKSIAVSFSVSPLLDEKRRVTGQVGIFHDVSQERAEENQRAEFISTASHEMRTPVAAIEGYLSLALNDKVAAIDARARDYLEKAHSSTQHLGQLFQDLLTSAKAEDGRLTSHPQVVEIGEFLEKLASDLKFAAEKKQLEMQFVFGTNQTSSNTTAGGDRVIRPFYYASVDPDRLREVVTNLFDNACKYTEKGKVTLGLTGDNAVVQLYVKDTGSGIPPEDINHLFQKFYRVDNSTTRTIGGTGLGLFICRKIVELYQGKIWVESTPGEGSTFFINLPRISTQKAKELMSVESSSNTILPRG
ncbi:PAS domain-containing protein [Candidatus Saccharibacteria bacterium]|jgi:PAS domain S-box-containing protein|nr:PAS domain-containing protein [Candidatus Saccharibacteria bacterium]HPR09022.1 ATP-binding protein [Candidatus Saccharibacteria bacterium]